MKAPALSKSQPSPPFGPSAGVSAKPWLAVDEVSASLGIGVTHLYALWKKGRGPHRLRIGRRVFVTPDALKAWIAGAGARQSPRSRACPAPSRLTARAALQSTSTPAHRARGEANSRTP